MLADLFETRMDVAIDLGTSKTSVFVRGEGLVASLPSFVAVREGANGARSFLCAGEAARLMQGRTPRGAVVMKPLRDGVVKDALGAALLVEAALKPVTRGRLKKPRVWIGAPRATTSTERRAVLDAVDGRAQVARLVEEPLAAALGAGLAVHAPRAQMLIDIGSGITEVVVLSLGGVAASRSVRIGGDHLNEAIVHFVRKRHDFLTSEACAEAAKIELGLAALARRIDGRKVELKGVDLRHHLPRTIEVDARVIAEAVAPQVAAIIDTARTALAETPPELSGDIATAGVVLSGGGALLAHFDALLAHELGVAVRLADDPAGAVARGVAALIA